MVRKTWPLSLLIAVVFSLGVFTLKGFGREEAFEKTKIEILSERIGEILKNQQDIIVRLEDIKSELNIIKIRASRR